MIEIGDNKSQNPYNTEENSDDGEEFGGSMSPGRGIIFMEETEDVENTRDRPPNNAQLI